ncbi:type IV pilus assembly protein PilW [Inhella inkyongensis]|uniref:Type IV pilus assembly protein PilW n=1 Tax=Inhella inkyongensis TaxID=392593 RepID=A0A840S475_9BURK|nr:PilW family protein [Inhella inkyongensis]MBB5203614.1 type IV pilus assembly protein PilW [Inhella inkyongensis]
MTNRSRGFSLVELLIAVAMGVVILLALTVMFARNSSSQGELERSLRQLENARFAVDTLSEDLMHGGYFSDFSPESLVVPPAYQTLDPCANAVTAMGWDTDASPVKLPNPVQGVAATDLTATCLTERRTGTEAIVVTHADTGAAQPVSAASAGNLYLQMSRCPTDVKRVVAATGPASAPFSLQKPDCSSVNDSIRRLAQRTYYVANCNDCTAKDGIPTLKRVEFIDGARRITSIAEGVENIQFEFGYDTDNNAIPDGFETISSAAAKGGAYTWDNVVSVRMHLLTRNTQTTSNYEDVRTYKLGPDVTVTKPSDGFKRNLMTVTVRLQNVGGRRE